MTMGIEEKQTLAIKACCRKLLEDQTAELILAYTGGGVSGMCIPYFVRTLEDVERIQWGNRCTQQLAPYLAETQGKVAVVAKPCDVRAIVQLIHEKQLKREDIYIIGVDCPGMVDAEGAPRPGCDTCSVTVPPIYDTHVPLEETKNVSFSKKELNGNNIAENWERFQKEMDKCILCFACRQTCYGCYCQTCFIERNLPDWQPTDVDMGTKMTFHLGRAMHLAGRCVECGSCEAACASGVNVRYIIQAVTDFIGEQYDYRTGMDLETTAALLTHQPEDREMGFLGGEGHA